MGYMGVEGARVASPAAAAGVGVRALGPIIPPGWVRIVLAASTYTRHFRPQQPRPPCTTITTDTTGNTMTVSARHVLFFTSASWLDIHM